MDTLSEPEELARYIGPSVVVIPPEQVAAMDVVDSLMHSIWLHGDWRWLTRNMTTPERETAADAVERHWARQEAEDPSDTVGAETRAHLRWWRDDVVERARRLGREAAEAALRAAEAVHHAV